MSQSNTVNELFQRYYGELRSLIASRFRHVNHEADDIVQDAFHNVLKISDFDSIENPKAYLYQTAANLALNRIRNQRRRKDALDALQFDELNHLSPERILMARRDVEKVQQAFDSLPRKYQTTFYMSRNEQKSYKEISQELNIPESTIEKHMIKSLKHLRSHLANSSEEARHE